MIEEVFDPRGRVLREWSFHRWAALQGVQRAWHRTGETLVVQASSSPIGEAVVLKHYRYPTARDRRRGLMRNTFLAPSRARREASMLDRLARHGLQPPLAIAFGEQRRRGILHHCFLVTRFVPGESLDVLLRAGSAEDVERELARLARFVRRLHDAGYVDRDLHLRNLILGANGTLHKIDNPRSRFVPRLLVPIASRRDLRELGAELAEVLGAGASARFLELYRGAPEESSASRDSVS